MTKAIDEDRAQLALTYYEDGARVTAAEIWGGLSLQSDREYRQMMGRIDDARAAGTPTIWAIIEDMLAYEREQFEGAPDTDLSVSGADLVDAFTQWREQLKAAVARLERRS